MRIFRIDAVDMLWISYELLTQLGRGSNGIVPRSFIRCSELDRDANEARREVFINPQTSLFKLFLLKPSSRQPGRSISTQLDTFHISIEVVNSLFLTMEISGTSKFS